MSRPALLRLLLTALALSVLIMSIRGRELFVGDETKYGQVIREMRQSHVFFLPTLLGTPFTHKPPMHFWMIDLLTFLFGVYSIWSFVIPSLLAFAFLLWVMARYSGPLAAFLCGSFAMIWASAQTARMDVSFTALIALAAFLMERFFEEERFQALLLAGIALAIATLIKGPMAPVIGLALFGCEWLRRRRVPCGNYWPAAAAMIVIPLLWVVPAMILGGSAYTREIVVKQTVGRAVSSWVHNYPPWYYLAHSPGFLFPWFFVVIVAAVALRHGSERARFCLSWIAAVLVPYSLMSSKLDVYMMALMPPCAVLIAELLHDPETRPARIAHWLNVVTLAILGAAGIVALTSAERWVKGPDAALLTLPAVRGVFIVLIVASTIGLAVAVVARSVFASTIAVGVVTTVFLTSIAIALTPLANDMASTRPLVAAIEKQHVAAGDVALYWCPFLWTHDMPRDLEGVHYVNPEDFRSLHPAVIVTSRVRAVDIAEALRGYRKVDELRMIGKWFDVYRVAVQPSPNQTRQSVTLERFGEGTAPQRTQRSTEIYRERQRGENQRSSLLFSANLCASLCPLRLTSPLAGASHAG
jgi:4-amino-4-deoxy-L-arabinose transferase-like glycosyltransferase